MTFPWLFESGIHQRKTFILGSHSLQEVTECHTAALAAGELDYAMHAFLSNSGKPVNVSKPPFILIDSINALTLERLF